MHERSTADLSRRSFLQRTATVAGASSLLLVPRTGRAQQRGTAFPRRQLGRTGRLVSTLTLGTWPCGKSSEVDIAGIGKLVDASLELGINFIDAANVYGKAEEALGIALKGRRDQVLLTSKVWADTADEADQSLQQSLERLGTSYLDVVYIHSIGNRDVKKVMGKGGSLEYLLQKKKEGVVKSIGISGHHYPAKFVPLIKTDQIDVLLCAMNFVDRHTYGFETKVLPEAVKHKMGVVCMKVYGGMRGGFPAASGPNTGPMIQSKFKQQAVRYALGLRGVSTCVIGPHTVEQLQENAGLVREFQLLSREEFATLVDQGKQLATDWKDHFGPVV